MLTERTTWRAQVVIALGALLGYWALMTQVPVPGFGPGVLTPEGNLAGYLDRAVLGAHLATRLGDPEGLLSTIPAIATALAGVFAGDWLSRPGAARHRTMALCAAGLTAAAIGLAWDRVFPINKNLWTSSFAIFSAGLAAVVLATAHWVLDVQGMARVGGAVPRVRAESAGRLRRVGRARRRADAMDAGRRRVGERRDLPARVRVVDRPAGRQQRGVARVRAGVRGALGGHPRRDAPPAGLRRDLRILWRLARYLTETPAPMTTSRVRGLPGKPLIRRAGIDRVEADVEAEADVLLLEPPRRRRRS